MRARNLCSTRCQGRPDCTNPPLHRGLIKARIILGRNPTTSLVRPVYPCTKPLSIDPTTTKQLQCGHFSAGPRWKDPKSKRYQAGNTQQHFSAPCSSGSTARTKGKASWKVTEQQDTVDWISTAAVFLLSPTRGKSAECCNPIWQLTVVAQDPRKPSEHGERGQGDFSSKGSILAWPAKPDASSRAAAV